MDDDPEATGAAGGMQRLRDMFQVHVEPAKPAANKSSKGPGGKGGKKKKGKKKSSGRGNPEELCDIANTGGIISNPIARRVSTYDGFGAADDSAA